MTSGHSLQVKAILMKEGKEEGVKEVRRFQVEEIGDKQRFQSLLIRVYSVFDLKPNTLQCSLYWKDEDGDLVRLSSEEELRHAVDDNTDDTLLIYVIAPEGGSEGSTEPRPDVTAGNRSNPHAGATFQTPPPFLPPHFHHHPHGPPPHFPGPWAHCGWKKWKPMGPCGWKGGWKRSQHLGCPGSMWRDMHGYGRMGRWGF